MLQQFESVHIDLNKVDTLIRWASKDKKFTIKNCYSVLIKQLGHWDNSWPWKMIRKTKDPAKVACFGWVTTSEAWLTQNNLQKRGFNLCNGYFLCQENQETMEHLFLHCKISRESWELFLNHRGINWVMPQKVKDLLEGWQEQAIP